ncbi:MAG: hypothetical protein KDH88_11820 [Chromatiales bacterium]|nr:hypothetical protein [Chromatiales bacterium]
MGRVLLALIVWIAGSAWAAEDGRYQALLVGGEAGGAGASGGGRVFIIDSRDGHFWTWVDSDVVPGQNGRLRVGSVLRYQGRLRVGDHPGEVIVGGGR